jgi:hypothetical protein
MMNKTITQLLGGAALLFTLLTVTKEGQAAPPATLHFQGYLTNAAGTPINSAMTAIRLNLYTVSGTQLYSESVVVPVNNGHFSATFGNAVALTLPFDEPYMVGIKVAGDPEMTPRQPLAASAYAFRAKTADALGENATGDSLTLGGSLNISNSQPIRFGGNFFIHKQGTENTSVGDGALGVTTGIKNTAFGRDALTRNSVGSGNTAAGVNALGNNVGGNGNTAVGENALIATTGSSNVGIGGFAGSNLTSGSNNIAINHDGVAGESNTIRLGNSFNNRAFIYGVYNANIPTGREVTIDSTGQLGTTTAQRGEVSVGSGAAGVNTFTVTFPTAFAVAPKVVVTPKLDLDVADTFAVTIRSISTTQFRVNVYRLDTLGGSWGANMRLAWQAWN